MGRQAASWVADRCAGAVQPGIDDATYRQRSPVSPIAGYSSPVSAIKRPVLRLTEGIRVQARQRTLT
jgi:hypothetical protein